MSTSSDLVIKYLETLHRQRAVLAEAYHRGSVGKSDDNARAIYELQRRGAISPQRMCLSCRYFAPHAHRDRARPHHCRFIDAPLGESDLRVDCADHEEVQAA